MCLAEVFKQLAVAVPRDANDSPLDIHTTADGAIIISAWPLISFISFCPSLRVMESPGLTLGRQHLAVGGGGAKERRRHRQKVE